jgi:Ca2+-binding EF-hand superfamily protein
LNNYFLRRIDKNLSEEDLDEAFKEFDKDNNGIITFEEFSEFLEEKEMSQP